MTSTQPRKVSFSKVTAGILFGGMLLAGMAIQTAGSVGAVVISAKSSLRPAQIVALDGVLAQRLNVIRSSFGLAQGDEMSTPPR